jgi:hypothetical protein
MGWLLLVGSNREMYQTLRTQMVSGGRICKG